MNTNTPTSNVVGLFDANQKRDKLETSARQAKAVLSLLMTAMQDDSPPRQEVVEDVLAAIQALLSA